MEANREGQTVQRNFLGSVFGVFGYLLPASRNFFNVFRGGATGATLTATPADDAEEVNNLVNILREKKIFKSLFPENEAHGFTLDQLERLEALSNTLEVKLETTKTQLTRSNSKLLELEQPDLYLENLKNKALISEKEQEHFTTVQLKLVSSLMEERTKEITIAYHQKLSEEKKNIHEEHEQKLFEKESTIETLEKEKKDLEKELTRQKDTSKAQQEKQEAHLQSTTKQLEQEKNRQISDFQKTYEERINNLNEALAQEKEEFLLKLKAQRNELKSEAQNQIESLKKEAKQDLAEEREKNKEATQQLKQNANEEKSELKEKKDKKIQVLKDQILQLEEEKKNLSDANILLLKNSHSLGEQKPSQPSKPWLDTEEGIAWKAGKTNIKRFFPPSSYKAMRAVLKLINPDDKPFAKLGDTPRKENATCLFDDNYQASLLRLSIAVLTNHDDKKTFADILNTSDYVRSRLKGYIFPLSQEQTLALERDNTLEEASILEVLNKVALMERENYVAFNVNKCKEFGEKKMGMSKQEDDGTESKAKQLQSCIPGLQIVRLHGIFRTGRFFPFNNRVIKKLEEKIDEHQDHKPLTHSCCVLN